MSLRLLLPIAALAVTLAGPAQATATLTCDIADAAVAFSLQTAVGSEGATFSGLRGELTVKTGGGRPDGTVEIGQDNVAQRWIDGPELRLWLQHPGSEMGPVIDLVIVTRATSDTDYAGRYRLTLRAKGKTWQHKGRVGCVMG